MKRNKWLETLYQAARKELEYRMKIRNEDDEEWTILMAVMVIASKELRCNPKDTAL